MSNYKYFKDKKLAGQISLEPEAGTGKWLSREKLGPDILTLFYVTAAELGGRRAPKKALGPGLKLLLKDPTSEDKPFFFIYPKDKRGRAEIITAWTNKSISEEIDGLDKIKAYIRSHIPKFDAKKAGGAA